MCDSAPHHGFASSRSRRWNRHTLSHARSPCRAWRGFASGGSRRVATQRWNRTRRRARSLRQARARRRRRARRAADARMGRVPALVDAAARRCRGRWRRERRPREEGGSSFVTFDLWWCGEVVGCSNIVRPTCISELWCFCSDAATSSCLHHRLRSRRRSWATRPISPRSI